MNPTYQPINPELLTWDLEGPLAARDVASESPAMRAAPVTAEMQLDDEHIQCRASRCSAWLRLA